MKENEMWLTLDEILEISKTNPELGIWCINQEINQDFLSTAKEIAEIIKTDRDKIDKGWKFGKVSKAEDFEDYNDENIPSIEDKEINNNNNNKNKEYYLCYGEPDENIVYFSEKHAKDNWGDDWDDVPYEHNAGSPYNEDYSGPELRVENGRGVYNPIDIKEVKFKIDEEVFDIRKPCSNTLNSSYSVEDINNGAVAWLYIKSCDKENNSVSINADCTLTEFVKIIKSLNGTVEIKDLEK